MKYSDLILNSIGKTPMIKLDSSKCNIFAKCEFLNPTGSHKDRLYYYGIKKFEKSRRIKKGMTLVDFSSGNAGASLSLMASIFGYKSIIVRPSGFCIGKAIQIVNYGGHIVEVSAHEGVKALRQKALEITEQLGENGFMMHQTDREFNVEAFESLGDEIISYFLNSELIIDAFVCPIGTGGTFSAVSRKIRSVFPDVKVIAVDIKEAPALYNKFYNKNDEINLHNVEGMSVGEVFKNTDITLIDEVQTCPTRDAWENCKFLALKEHCLVGPSSGAGFYVSKQTERRLPEKSNILTIFWDQGWKYFSNYKEV